MPSPRMPTGTVSGGSNGSQTFPMRDAPRLERVRNASSSDWQTNDGTAAADSRSVHEELAHLRRENEELRRALHETRRQRQDVIDRYERLLDGGDSNASTGGGDYSAAAPADEDVPFEAAVAFVERVGAAVDARLQALRRRYRRWSRQSGR